MLGTQQSYSIYLIRYILVIIDHEHLTSTLFVKTHITLEFYECHIHPSHKQAFYNVDGSIISRI